MYAEYYDMELLRIRPQELALRIVLMGVVCCLFTVVILLLITATKSLQLSSTTNTITSAQSHYFSIRLASAEARIRALESEDQRVRNNKLEMEVIQVKKQYARAVSAYEDVVKLREQKAKTTPLDGLLAESFPFLAKVNYASASARLSTLEAEIEKLQIPVSTEAITISANTTTNNTPPTSGYSQQVVETNGTRFLVDIVASDLSTTKVVVETASSGDCGDNCSVDSLASYVGKAGGFAGINGPYFCPESYPSCSGKKNSFDTLLMNRNKTYFNSANNVYSSVPAVIFGAGYARFVGASSEWGRDTSPDSVIASQPLLLSGGEIRFGGDSEIKRSGRGSRSFIASKGTTAYIGVVHNANVAEVALVLKAFGMDNGLNLDSGGSTALYASGRYVVGPGRNTPFGIVFASR